MKLLLTVCLALLAGAAQADMSVNFGGVTRHFRNDAQHCDLNYGIGLQWDPYPDVGLAGGTYHNSECRPTEYLVVRYEPLEFGGIRAGALAGLVTGYASPAFAAPTISASFGRLTVRLVGVPSVDHQIDGFVSLQFGWKLP